MKRICVLPGDGVGPEVVECAVEVLRAVTDELEFEYAEIGEQAMTASGSYLPDETVEMMRSCDSCLFGAVTSPDIPDYDSPVLKFRKVLGLYACVRPVRTLFRRTDMPPIDVVIVRESSEGMYTQNEVFDDDGVTTLRRVTRKASERIVDFAIKYALDHRRTRLCCVHKSNVLRSSDGLFLEVFKDRAGKAGGGLRFDDHLVDSAAMKLVTKPDTFDVIVTMNLYGDILSDVAAGVAGGLGFAPSGSIGPKHSVFEPSHGSAPDIAGKDLANPTAAILAGAMMLDQLDLAEEAQKVRRAVSGTYASGHLTVDLGGRHGCRSFTDHVVSAIGRMPR